ncbi:mCG145100, partial [Mus musculus]
LRPGSCLQGPSEALTIYNYKRNSCFSKAYLRRFSGIYASDHPEWPGEWLDSWVDFGVPILESKSRFLFSTRHRKASRLSALLRSSLLLTLLLITSSLLF